MLGCCIAPPSTSIYRQRTSASRRRLVSDAQWHRLRKLKRKGGWPLCPIEPSNNYGLRLSRKPTPAPEPTKGAGVFGSRCTGRGRTANSTSTLRFHEVTGSPSVFWPVCGGKCLGAVAVREQHSDVGCRMYIGGNEKLASSARGSVPIPLGQPAEVCTQTRCSGPPAPLPECRPGPGSRSLLLEPWSDYRVRSPY